MTLGLLVVLALGSGILALALDRWRIGPAIALVGLGAAAAIGASFPAEGSISVGGVVLLTSAPVREWVVVLAGLGLGLGLAALLVGRTEPTVRRIPAAVLLALGPAAIAIAATDDVTSVLAATAAGSVGALIAGTVAGSPVREVQASRLVSGAHAAAAAVPPVEPLADGPSVALREVRAAVATGVLGLLAVIALGGSLGAATGAPVLGLTVLAVAAAIAIRSGAIPVHFWAARLPDVASELALPVLLGIGPAIPIVALLAWSAASVVPLGASLELERAIVIGVGLATLALGAVAATINDDLGHVVAYAAIADAGVALLAFAALDPGAHAAAHAWLIAQVAARAALGAWLATVRARFGTRRLSELGGWLRRSPELGLILGFAVVAAIGWPGAAIFEARRTIVETAVTGPLGPLALAVSLGGIVYLGRIVAVGLRPAGRAVELAGAGRRPAAVRLRPATVRASVVALRAGLVAGRRAETARAATAATARATARAIGAGARGVRRGAAALVADRPALVALDALALAVFALAISGGAMGTGPGPGATAGR
jgi:hypothetical protein